MSPSAQAERSIPAFFPHCLTLQMRGFFAEFTLSGQSEILRFAQNDSEGSE
jgi:hypothetical protein